MEQKNIPTSTQDVITTNPQETDSTEKTVPNPISNAENSIDYKNKFSESSKEALRLYEENKAKDAEIERLRQLADTGTNYSNNSDSLYPGFELLGNEEQKNLIAYTNSIKKNTLEEVYKDPAIAFAKESYNARKWDEAFEQVASKRPELREARDDFKSKFFRPSNVPTNINEILEDLSKVYLFDKAETIGAQKAIEQANRIDIERSGGGDKTAPAVRSLEDWNKLAQQNPAKFAQSAKEFNSDMESGKLK